MMTVIMMMLTPHASADTPTPTRALCMICNKPSMGPVKNPNHPGLLAAASVAAAAPAEDAASAAAVTASLPIESTASAKLNVDRASMMLEGSIPMKANRDVVVTDDTGATGRFRCKTPWLKP
jgi:hypothetical protein